MNALELADKFEQKALTADAMEYGFEVDFEEAATMLRQQQAEIKELKTKLQLHEAMDNQCASLMQQFRKAQEQ